MNEKILRILVLLLSVNLALGSLNPFNVQIYEDPNSVFTPFIIGLIILISFFSKSIWNYLFLIKKQILILMLFFVVIFGSSLVYQSFNLNEYYIWFIKLLIALMSFITLSLFFVCNPKYINYSLLVYAITCSVVILAYQFEFIEDYVYLSKGRLFLFGENPNSTSSRMGFALLVFLYYILYDVFNLKKKRFIFLLLCFSIVFYIIKSGSRGTFGITLIAALFMLIFSKINISTKVVFMSLSVLIYIFFSPSVTSFVNSGEFSMFERIKENQGIDERTVLLNNAIEIFVDNPIIGVGINGYDHEKEVRGFLMLDSHNILATTFAIGGLTAGFILISFLFMMLKRSMLIYKISIMPFALFIYIFLISLKTGGVLTYVLMWYIYSISNAMSINITSEFLYLLKNKNRWLIEK